MRAQLAAQLLVQLDHVVERVGDLARHAGPIERHAGGEIALLHGGEDA